jgi:hypothetical protein
MQSFCHTYGGDSTSIVPNFQHCGDVKDFRNGVLPHGALFIIGGDHAGRTVHMQGWPDESCRVGDLIGPVQDVLGGVVMQGGFQTWEGGLDASVDEDIVTRGFRMTDVGVA